MSRLRETWQFARLPAVGAAFAAVIALGYWGAARSEAIPDGVTDRLYAALRLFALESDVSGPVPVQYEIARFAAPLLIGGAAVVAALLLFREEALRARAGLGRGHTVIVGLGERGRRLAHALSADPEHPTRVVAIDHGRDADAVAEAAAARIPVFLGDGTDARVLRRAGVHRARHVIFATADDLVNLEGAASVANATADAGAPPAIHVVVRDVELWRALNPSALENLANTRSIEFVSIEQRAAANLIAALPLEAFAERSHLLLVADGTLGEAVVAEAVTRSLALGVTLTISLLAENAVELVSRWEARNPAMTEVVEIRPVAASVSALAPELLATATSAGAAIVAVPDERVALAAALHLNRRHAVPPGHLVLAVPDQALAETLEDGSIVGIKVVGVLSGTLTRALLVDGTRERIARARHEHYVRERVAEGLAEGSAPALVPWDELPDSLKDSNRAFASRVARVLDELDATVVPRTIGPVDDSWLRDDELKWRLAEQEHGEWVREQEARGYEFGPERNDGPGALRHPSMVPFEELPESEKQKDFESIEALPSYLAQAGFEVARVHAR